MAISNSPETHARTFGPFSAVVGRTEDLTPRVRGIRFDLLDHKKLQFKAGQFVQIVIPTPDRVRRTSYSVASAPQSEEKFELCVTKVEGGVSSGFLHALKVGDKVDGMGPLGKFVLADDLARDLVFIATGSGIAPFRAMINDLLTRGVSRELYLVFGNRFEEDIIYRSEWDELQKKHTNLHVLHTLSRGEPRWSGHRGYVQEAVPEFVPQLLQKDFLVCGLVKMIDAVVEKLTGLGVPKEQIHFERYD